MYTLLLYCADLDRHCLMYQSFARSRVCAPGSVPGHALQPNPADHLTFPLASLPDCAFGNTCRCSTPPQLSASTDASTGSSIRSWIFGRPFSGHGTSAKMYTHLTPFCYIVQISTVIASCTSPLPTAASAHPVACLDTRFNQTLRSPDFPACQPSGLRVRECLPVLDPHSYQHRRMHQLAAI
ncbi:hypothetical protein MRX96_031454 [Rhipicephalus microplus]